MPEIQVRPIVAADLPTLIKIRHSIMTEAVWQMELKAGIDEVEVKFHEIRLPRPVRLDYPRSPRTLVDDWDQRSGVLVALQNEDPVGYVSLQNQVVPRTVLVTDLAVKENLRRKGIGTALLLAAQDWTRHKGCDQIIVEMQSKNFPGIRLAQKLGFEFCGYNDHYYVNQDIAIFFAKPIS